MNVCFNAKPPDFLIDTPDYQLNVLFIFNSVNSTLQTLILGDRLGGNLIGDKGATALSEALMYVVITSPENSLIFITLNFVSDKALSWFACVWFSAKTRRCRRYGLTTIRFVPRAQLLSSVHSRYILIQSVLVSFCYYYFFSCWFQLNKTCTDCDFPGTVFDYYKNFSSFLFAHQTFAVSSCYCYHVTSFTGK